MQTDDRITIEPDIKCLLDEFLRSYMLSGVVPDDDQFDQNKFYEDAYSAGYSPALITGVLILRCRECGHSLSKAGN
jgi:hypothetical protein